MGINSNATHRLAVTAVLSDTPVQSEKQQGIALITSLILLLVVVLMAVSSVKIALQEEKIARNQRQVVLAFMAAETGLSAAAAAFNQDRFVWDDAAGVRQLNAMQTSLAIMNGQTVVPLRVGDVHLAWQIPAAHIIHDTPSMGVDRVRLCSVGRVVNTDIVSRVEWDIVMPQSLFPMPPAPLTLAGYVTNFGVGYSASFASHGEIASTDVLGTPVPGTPALIFDQNYTIATDLNNLIAALSQGSDQPNYTGVGHPVPVIRGDLGPFWGNPNALRDFVELAKRFGTRYPGGTRFQLGDNHNIGRYTDSNNYEWAITVVEGDAVISGSRSGAGVFIVTGDLTWEGNAQFSGLVVVLGGEVYWVDEGNNSIKGGLYVANIDQTAPNWRFIDDTVVTTGVVVSGSGTATLNFNRPILDQIRHSASPRIVNWREVYQC